MKLHTLLSDILVGIPGGLLIFMGTLMFNAVLGKLFSANAWTVMFILCATSFLVGLMARWMRPIHGLGTAIASGIVAASILLVLWQTSTSNPETALAVGPVGMLVTIAFSTLGGWAFPLLRKSRR
jgi:hypothetical protein